MPKKKKSKKKKTKKTKKKKSSKKRRKIKKVSKTKRSAAKRSKKNNIDKSSELFSLNLAGSFRVDENFDLPKSSYISQKTSNLVGQSKIKLNEFLDLEYDFLSDNNLGQFHYHNINSKIKINNCI